MRRRDREREREVAGSLALKSPLCFRARKCDEQGMHKPDDDGPRRRRETSLFAFPRRSRFRAFVFASDERCCILEGTPRELKLRAGAPKARPAPSALSLSLSTSLSLGSAARGLDHRRRLRSRRVRQSPCRRFLDSFPGSAIPDFDNARIR